MTTGNEIHIDSKNLLQQLESLQFLADASWSLLNIEPVSREFLAFKIEIARNMIQELEMWEKLHDQRKCNCVIQDAQFFLAQIQAFFDHMLEEQCEAAWRDAQSELRFTRHAYRAYEYLLSNNINSFPDSIAG